MTETASKIGRRPRRKRTLGIKVPLTNDEKILMEEAADRATLPVSTWIKLAALKEAKQANAP